VEFALRKMRLAADRHAGGAAEALTARQPAVVVDDLYRAQITAESGINFIHSTREESAIGRAAEAAGK
jgi:hypothetical protein